MAKEKLGMVEDQEEILADLNLKYVYVLSQRSDPRGRVFDMDGNPLKSPEYMGRRNLLLRSSIVWPGGKDPFSGKERPRGRYLIRYYDGCSTLFVDEQPQLKETIDTFVASTRELHFVRGYLEIYGYETTLKNYLDWCSWNEESPYRVKKVDAVFKLLDSEAARVVEADNLNRMEEALEKAKNAKPKHMRIHAKFLEIPELDFITSAMLSDDAIRTEYRKVAMNKPELFLRTFNDKTLHIKYWIEQALQTGEISTSILPNQAVWAKQGLEICNISGLKSKEGILNKLIEFSQTAEGEEFKTHLEGLYN